MTTALPDGQRVIATYKLVKGSVQIVLAGVFAAFVVTGGTAHVASIAAAIHPHVPAAWSLELARLLTVRHIELTGLALLFDGIFSLGEGWALRARRWWGPWVVSVATSLLVPLEIVAIARHPHWPRAIALAVNVAIVAYLARKAWRDHVIRRGVKEAAARIELEETNHPVRLMHGS
jgi:uncharacterized membrane protein (DUF2068 family)